MIKLEIIVEKDELHIIISSNVSIYAKFILGFLVCLSVVGCIGIPVAILFNGIPNSSNLFLSMSVFVLTSILTVRLFLWNVYGKELLIFKNDKFSYQYDYKLFKSEFEELDASQFVARAYQEDSQIKESFHTIDNQLLTNNEETTKLEIILPEDNFISNFILQKEQLNELITKINHFKKRDIFVNDI